MKIKRLPVSFKFVWTIVALTAFFLLPRKAFAYIDPGTGSAILYIVVSVITSLYFLIKGIWYKLRDLFNSRSLKSERCNVAIHSEDARYELVFLPIMKHLSRLGIDYTYYTMYPRDNSFEPLETGTKHVEISNGLVGYSFLNRLRAKMLVTTTPQLDIMTFKRSRNVSHYMFVQHALGEARYMRPFSYDYFDSVMCCGPLVKKSIRLIEKIRNQPEKELFEAGIPHYDELIARRKVQKAPGESARKTILVAPSWGELSIFKIFKTEFLQKLVAKFDVIVRPHPQMKISQKELYDEVISAPGIELDEAPTFEDSMSRADVLISDISGIIHEFAFVYEKPVIVAEYEKNLEPFEGYLLNESSELVRECESFIVSMTTENFTHLEEQIDRIIADFSVNQVRDARDRLIYNFGTSGRRVAEKIKEITLCLS